MKLDARRVEAFLARPDPALDIALVHGPDTGAVTELVEGLARAVVDDPGDPFRAADLAAEALAETPGRLAEEALALSLLGGRRLVRVRRCSDRTCRAALEQVLALGRPAAFILLEAGELAGGSWLRKTAEQHRHMAAIACWREDAGQLRRSVPVLLHGLGLRAAPDALDLLVASLGEDRGAGRRELEKLALYKTGDPTPVSRADVAAVVGDGAALALDDVVWAALGGEPRRLHAALDRLLAEGESPIRVLRATAGTVTTLLRLRLRVDAGARPADAVAAARPPVFWNARDRFVAALRRHDARQLAAALADLQAAEIACKSAGSPDELLCRAALDRIAAAGR